MKTKNILILALFLILNACQNKDNIEIVVYNSGNDIKTFSGIFYTTKYGGLNYFIPNETERKHLFNVANVDSISFVVNSHKYISKPLIHKPFSRQKNNSDFNFYVNEKESKILVDTVDNMATFLIFSEKTNLEKLKDTDVIKAIYLENVK